MVPETDWCGWERRFVRWSMAKIVPFGRTQNSKGELQQEIFESGASSSWWVNMIDSYQADSKFDYGAVKSGWNHRYVSLCATNAFYTWKRSLVVFSIKMNIMTILESSLVFCQYHVKTQWVFSHGFHLCFVIPFYAANKNNIRGVVMGKVSAVGRYIYTGCCFSIMIEVYFSYLPIGLCFDWSTTL